jgi:hypothetical protein
MNASRPSSTRGVGPARTLIRVLTVPPPAIRCVILPRLLLIIFGPALPLLSLLSPGPVLQHSLALRFLAGTIIGVLGGMIGPGGAESEYRLSPDQIFCFACSGCRWAPSTASWH